VCGPSPSTPRPREPATNHYWLPCPLVRPYVVGATGFEPVTSSVSGKNQSRGISWHSAFPQVNGRTGVSGTDRWWPRLSGGPCPRCAPNALSSSSGAHSGSLSMGSWWVLATAARSYATRAGDRPRAGPRFMMKSGLPRGARPRSLVRRCHPHGGCVSLGTCAQLPACLDRRFRRW
jgi:hypothetical protein